MSNERPKLTDPQEYAIIKSMYFDDNRPINDDLDPIEKLDRLEAKQRNNKPSSQ